MSESPSLPPTLLPPGFGATPAHVDRDARMTTILLVAHLSRAGGDNLCRIRNLSSGGMSIDTLSPLSAGERVSIAMKTGAVVAAEVVWTLGSEAGLRFDHPIDVADLLAIGARQPRTLRFATRCPVMLRRNGYLVRGMLADISQGGAKICLADPGFVGDSGTLAIPGLESQRAVVRWVGDGAAGVSFASSLTFATLSHWLAGDRRFCVGGDAPLSPVRQNS